MTDSAAQAAEDAAAAANHAAIVAPANTGTAFTIPSNTPVFTQGGANGAIDYNAERTYIMENMGYDPLGQLSPSATAQPGSANYGLSREYYTLNPDSEFNSLTAQYATQHSNILTESSGAAGVNGVTGQTNYTAPAVYDTSSAAGIAAMLAGVSGGVPQTTSSLIDIARTEGYTGPALVTSGISTMPTITSVDRATLAQGAALTLPESALTGGTLTLYGPGIGAMNTAYREGVKVAVSPLTGEISEYTLDPWGNYGLIGGAGRYAAQSGEFSVAKYNDTNTKQIWNLNLDTISPFYTENLSKSEAPGADIPGHVSSDASALMLMDQTGIYGSVTVPSVTIPSTSSTTTKGYDFSQGTFTPVTEKDLTGGGGFGALAADNFPGVSLGFITLGGGTTKSSSDLGTLNGLKIVSATPAGSVNPFGTTVPGSYSLQTTVTPGTAGKGPVDSFLNAVDDATQTLLINPINSVVGTNFNIEPDYGSTTYQSSYQATLPAPFVSGDLTGYKASPVTFDIVESPVTVKNQGGIQTVSSVLGSTLPAWDYDPEVKAAANSGFAGELFDFGHNVAQSGYSAFKENPIQFVATSGFWAGVTIATEGIGGDLAAAAEGGSKVAGAALSVSPYIKGGLALGFGAEAVSQTTEGFTVYDPSQMGQNFGKFAESSIAPMIVGGIAGNALYNTDLGNVATSIKNIYETTNFPETPDLSDFSNAVSKKASDVVYNFQQSRMGIENIGIDSGRSYFAEPAFGSAGTFGDVPEAGIFSTSTSIVTVPFERTVSGTAYDVIDANAKYNPDLSELTLSINRNLIQPSDIGKVNLIEYTNRAVLNTDVYAVETGIDLQLGDTPKSIAVTDVFKTFEETDVYPSGRSYTRTISQKGRAESIGSDIAGVLSSRGITYGESSIAQRQMDIADQIIRGGVYKNRNPLELSETDLPGAIADISVGYGRISIESNLPVASRADVIQVTNRIVRAPESLDLMLQKSAEEIYGTSGGEGVTPRNVQMGTEKNVFKTLPEVGVVVSERFGDVLGKRIGSIQTSENTFSPSEDIGKILYGRETSTFEYTAAKLRIASEERLVKSGFERKAPTSKTPDNTSRIPKVKTGIKELQVKAESGTAILKSESNPASKLAASDVLLQYGKLITAMQEGAKEIIPGEPSGGITSYAPRNVVFEEEEAIPNREALKRTGLYERGATTRESARVQEEMRASVPVFSSISRTAIASMSEVSNGSTQSIASILGQSQEQKSGLDYVTAFDVASIAASRIGSDQAQFLDYVTAFDVASTTELKTEQTPDQIIDQVPAYLQTPELTTDQIVTPVQIPAILQIPDVVVTQIPDEIIPPYEPPAIPIPPPAIPIPAGYTFSGFGGSSVSKTWRKRIQLEIFGMGTDTRAVRALGINVRSPPESQIKFYRTVGKGKIAEVTKSENDKIRIVDHSGNRNNLFTMPSVRMPSRRIR